FDDLEGEQYDQRRQVQVQGHRQPVADRAQDGLGHAVQKAHDRVVGVRVHPGDQRAGDDDPEVYPEGDFEHPRDREDDITQDEHYVGPCPSSRERSVARSTALMKVVRMPPSSSAAIPAIDVPPGELTMSLSAPGCRFVSSRSLAAPSTVCVASVIAVTRSSPIFTPPSASDSMTTATYAGPEPDRPVTASISSSSITTTLPTAPTISSTVSRSPASRSFAFAIAVAPSS